MKIGIDLGGTKLAFAVIDDNGRVLKHEVIETAIHRGGDFMIEQIKTELNKLFQEYQVDGIGFAVPGLFEGTKILNTPNVPVLNGIDLKEALEFDVDLVLENDGNCFALGEHRHGAGKGTTNMVGLTIGTGLGAGIVINKQLFTGSFGNAGEISNTIYDPNAETVQFGNRSATWDCLINGNSILRRHSRAGGKEKKCTDVWESDNEQSKQTLNESARHLAIFTHNLIRIFDPEKVVVGGGANHPNLIAKANELLENNYGMKPVLCVSQLGDLAGMVGAVACLKSSSVIHNSNKSFF